jgi:hypothetical protein
MLKTGGSTDQGSQILMNLMRSRIRIHNRVKSWIRTSTRVESQIRIRIEVMRIRNTGRNYYFSVKIEKL